MNKNLKFDSLNDLYLCRELGHGQMGLHGTMQTGHPINQMMVMVERTAWICGENMTSLMMQIVHWHSLTSARNKTIICYPKKL
jgi:hypothetical protein